MKYAAAYLLVRRAYVHLRRISHGRCRLIASFSHAPRVHVWSLRVVDVHQSARATGAFHPSIALTRGGLARRPP